MKSQSMMQDPKHALPIEENTDEERRAQYKRDKEALAAREQETDMLIKELEKIKVIDRLAEETKHADRFKNIKYIDRGEEEKLGSIFDEPVGDSG